MSVISNWNRDLDNKRILYALSVDFSILELWLIENEAEAPFSNLSIIASPDRYIRSKDNDGSSWGSRKGQTITYGFDTLKKEIFARKIIWGICFCKSMSL